MTYKRLTFTGGSPINDEMIETVKSKYLPAVKAMGGIGCELFQTGPDSAVLITTYPDKATADSAAGKAATLRAESREEFQGTEHSVLEGEVIATM